MPRAIICGEVRTGRRITQIPVAAASWSQVHRGIGEITVDIPLDADEFRRLERSWLDGGLLTGPGVLTSPSLLTGEAPPVWAPGDGMRPEFLQAIEPVRCFLGVMEGDAVLEAGPIWSWEYDDATGILQVRAGGMGSLFDHRYVMGVLAGGWQQWEATYADLSLGTIAKRLVQLLETHTGGELPVVFQPDEAGPHTRTYQGHELATARQRLDDLAGVIGGPDIAFEPRLTGDRLGVEWVMRTGTQADPLLHQPGDDHVWDARAVRTGVGGLNVRRDAMGMAGVSWATGSGLDEALLMARAQDGQLVAAGFPLLEVAQSRSNVEDQGTLVDWASAGLRAGARPWQTWSATVRADLAPLLGTYRPGDWAKIWVPTTHRLLSMLLPQGHQRARIMRISGSLTDDVQIEWAPTQEVR